MKTINNLKTLVLAAGFMLLLIHPQIGKAQLSKFMINLSDTSNYFNVRPSLLNRIDSLRNVLDSATFYSGAGEYKEFKRFDDFWMPRIYPHGKISKYLDYEGYFINNLRNSYDYYTEEPWVEIGPFKEHADETTMYRGVGPSEFIKIFNDGTPQSTRHMLTGSLPGGLFYSDNWGVSWTNAGTDKWERSGVSSAVFNPKNVNAWFASSSGNSRTGRSGFVGKTGGVYRTNNKGVDWTKIADYQDLLSEWNIIYKIDVNPADSGILYVVTKYGIFRTINAQAENPSWEMVNDCFAYDIEVKPYYNDTLYATIYDNKNDNRWKIIKSVNRGLTWTPIINQPPHSLDSIGLRFNSITIETSFGKPDNLYCLVKDFDSVFVYYANMATDGVWNLVGKHYDNFYYGDGHGFGVDQILGEKIVMSYLPKLKLYEIGGSSKEFSLAHMDCEDAVFHPYAGNKLWLSTHGGVEVIEDVDTYDVSVSMNHGLAIAQAVSTTTASSNLGYTIGSFDHCAAKITNGKYTDNWETDWRAIKHGDAISSVIDPKEPSYMWTSFQNGSWFQSDNFFSTAILIPNPFPLTQGAYWNAEGALNKFHPNVFYRNNWNLTGTNEDIYRSKTRGEGEMQPNVNEFISNFQSVYGNSFKYTIINGIVSSNTDENSLLIKIIGINPNQNQVYQLWINRNAMDLASNAISSWQQVVLPRIGVISDFHFHPDDHEKIYVVYSSAANTNATFANEQIFLIDLANNTTLDITKSNLPLSNLGSLIVINNDPMAYFVATDFGVYYTNDQLTEWQLVGKGLPNVGSTKLELNTSNRTLRLGTYGRGVWELALPCEASSGELVVQTDTRWDSPRYLTGNLKISNNATLTLGTNAIVAMPENKKIVIEQGSKLVVDGARITSSCAAPWQGIEVWGNTNASQYALPGQPCPQGKLVLQNGATIENAFNAVALWKPGDYSKSGGIIVATDAVFKNNKRSVEFISYQNFNPLDTSVLFGNASYFINCTFIVDENYMLSNSFSAQVTLWNVDGVHFKGNKFQSKLNGTNGKGIYSIDANYKLQSLCNSQIVPCPNESRIPNSFSGFETAIDASNSQSLRSIFVDQTSFSDNGYGIKLYAVNNASITRSNFVISKLSQAEAECETDFGIGIELTNCNDFFLEENNLTSSGQWGGSQGTIGIRVANRFNFNPNPTTIYKNQFKGIERANLAEGKNFQDNYPKNGLVYECNANSFNGFDFYFTGLGVAGDQGSLSKAAGNTFSTFATIPELPVHISNLAENHVDYYYFQATNHRPRYTINTTNHQISAANSCPSSFGGGSGEIELMGLSTEQQSYFEAQLDASRAAYNNISNLYASLKDGGNTSTMLTAVDMAWPDDMWELRAELLGASPHLSKEVLKKAADRTDVLPESIIFEVLSTNPDELKDAELMEYLQTKAEPLPDYMIEVLESLRENITYKTILQSQMAYQSQQKARAERALLHNLVHNQSSDLLGLRNQLAAAQSLPTDMQLVDVFLQEGKTNQALGLAAMLPQLYALTGEALAEHNRYMSLKQLQANLLDADRTIFDLDATEKATLLDLIGQSNGLAGTQARNIMAFIGEYDYCDCPAPLDKALKMKQLSNTNIQTLLSPSVEVRPNPANNWVSFAYTLEGEQAQAVLELRDAAGKTVHQVQLSQPKGEYVWDTRELQPGTYYYSLKTANTNKTGKVVIVK